MSILADSELPDAAVNPGRSGATTTLRRYLRHPPIAAGTLILGTIVLLSLCAPLLAPFDPTAINTLVRNKAPGFVQTIMVTGGAEAYLTHWLGTDGLGRDVLSRILYGVRTSLAIGFVVAGISVSAGLMLGVVSGYVRWLDGIMMRIVDGLMAIPPILLAMAIVTLFRSGFASVVLAIIIPDIPRVVRLVRSKVLSIREQAYVHAAVTLGTPTLPLILRHVLPNAVTPALVQGTFICASAMLVEAVLSFLGIGIPPETPTLGNIMADGRQLFRLLPGNVFFPAIVLALTILSINLLGDGFRDMLDEKYEDGPR